MNKATWITIARLPLTVAAIMALASRWDGRWLTAAICVDLVGNTDYLDGWLARRRGEVTALGTNLDFALDKVCVAALLFTLAWLRLVSVWVPLLVLAREVVVTSARIVRFGAHPPPSDIWGKAKTGLTLTAIAVILLRQALPGGGGAIGWLLDLGPSLMLAAVALTLLSGLNYMVRYTRHPEEID